MHFCRLLWTCEFAKCCLQCTAHCAALKRFILCVSICIYELTDSLFQTNGMQRVIDETDPEIVKNAAQVKVRLHQQCQMFLVYCFLNLFDVLLPSLVVLCPQTLVFCTGQIYYELLGEREKLGGNNVALVRLEQIAPFPFDCVAENAKKYSNAEIVWAQQEPK